MAIAQKKYILTYHQFEAFTLIELLVTVAILGILASMAMSMFDSYRRRANDSVALGGFKNAITALEAGSEIESTNWGDYVGFNIRPDQSIECSNQSGIDNCVGSIEDIVKRLMPGFTPQKNVGMQLFKMSSQYKGNRVSGAAAHCLGSVGFVGDSATVVKHYTYTNGVMTDNSSAYGGSMNYTVDFRADGSDCPN